MKPSEFVYPHCRRVFLFLNGVEKVCTIVQDVQHYEGNITNGFNTKFTSQSHSGTRYKYVICNSNKKGTSKHLYGAPSTKILVARQQDKKMWWWLTQLTHLSTWPAKSLLNILCFIASQWSRANHILLSDISDPILVTWVHRQLSSLSSLLGSLRPIKVYISQFDKWPTLARSSSAKAGWYTPVISSLFSP